MKIFINPGHAPDGIPDPGAINKKTGHKEALLVAQGGKLLRDYLEKRGHTTYLFQSDSLHKICQYANLWEPHIFVSLHCNAHNTFANGSETHWFSGKGALLAESIQREIEKVGLTVNRGTKESKWIYVLRGTKAPAVLVELAFIDHDGDLQVLLYHMDELIEAVGRGIEVML